LGKLKRRELRHMHAGKFPGRCGPRSVPGESQGYNSRLRCAPRDAAPSVRCLPARLRVDGDSGFDRRLEISSRRTRFTRRSRRKHQGSVVDVCESPTKSCFTTLGGW
jgi:hypothetical protein